MSLKTWLRSISISLLFLFVLFIYSLIIFIYLSHSDSLLVRELYRKAWIVSHRHSLGLRGKRDRGIQVVMKRKESHGRKVVDGVGLKRLGCILVLFLCVEG